MLFNLAVTLLIAYLGIVFLVFAAQAQLIYFPQTARELAVTPEQIGLAYESVEITTSDDETLHGWFVPVPEAQGTVLFFHGNAGNISHRMDYMPMFQRLGYNFFIIDYRGYGQSSGSPSEAGTYLDAEAAWRYLTEAKGIAPSQIVLYGESLGGPIAAWLAARQKPAGLILASSFTSAPDLAETIYPFLPVRLIARINYNTLEFLASITAPVLVMHSPQDEIVPFVHGQNLFQAASEPKQFLTLEGGHNSGFVFMREEWITALGAFLDNNNSRE
jgi:uncharacterized protein